MKLMNNIQDLDEEDAESHQDRIDAIEGIRRGLESMKLNAGKPVEEFFREFFAENGFAQKI